MRDLPLRQILLVWYQFLSWESGWSCAAFDSLQWFNRFRLRRFTIAPPALLLRSAVAPHRHVRRRSHSPLTAVASMTLPSLSSMPPPLSGVRLWGGLLWRLSQYLTSSDGVSTFGFYVSKALWLNRPWTVFSERRQNRVTFHVICSPCAIDLPNVLMTYLCVNLVYKPMYEYVRTVIPYKYNIYDEIKH
jgi:hypothetical protein